MGTCPASGVELMGNTRNGRMWLTAPEPVDTPHVTGESAAPDRSNATISYETDFAPSPKKEEEKGLELKSDQASRANHTHLCKLGGWGGGTHVKAAKQRNPESGKFYRTSKLVSSTNKLSERGRQKKRG